MYALTVSPDPERIVNKAQKRSYFVCTGKEQYNVIKSGLREAVHLTMQEFMGEGNRKIELKVWFELNESGMLHCHGNLECPVELVKVFQRMVFRTLGRVYFKANMVSKLMEACVHIVDMDHVVNFRKNEGMVSWDEYCLKDQTDSWSKRYPPYVYYEEYYEWEEDGHTHCGYYCPERPRIF